LYSRPYSIEGKSGTISMESLKIQTSLLKESLPNSKIKDLREVLTQDQISKEVFIEHLKHQHEEFKRTFCKDITSRQVLERCPFFDMIELLELYPANLLNIDKNATREI
jgi:hypothetical protein